MSVLNVVIGLIFIYLLYSLLATTIQETISTILHRRANTLFDGIKSMLSDTKKDKGFLGNFFRYITTDLVSGLKEWFDKLFTGKKSETLYTKFYDHPIIKNYGQNLFFKKPSYLTSENFSSILIETLKKLNNNNLTAATDFEIIKKVVEEDKGASQKTVATLPGGTTISIASGSTAALASDAIVTLDPGTMVTQFHPRSGNILWKVIMWVTDFFPNNKIPFEVSASLPSGTTVLLASGATVSIPADTIISFDPKANLSIVSNGNNFEIDKETRDILLYHLNEAAGDIDVFRYRIEKWFNDTMDRVSGWYKRNTQFYLLFVGFALAVMLNIDSIQITNFLSDNKTARDQLAKMGEAAASNQQFSGGDSIIAKEALDSIKAQIGKTNTIVGLGWGDYGSSDKAYKNYRISDSIRKIYCCATDTLVLYKAFKKNLHIAESIFIKDSSDICNSMLKDTTVKNNDIEKVMDSITSDRNDIISQKQFALLYKNKDFESNLQKKYIWFQTWHIKKLLGFLLTALAISLGAPFWFDLLNKFISLRTAVKTVDSSGSTTKNNTSDNNDIDG